MNRQEDTWASMMSGGWINKSFAALPGADDDLFRRLWTERRLVFDEQREVGDVVDEYSARLVAAALRRRERLLVVLPDFQAYRPALLLATGLIRHWWDSQAREATESRSDLVLYFGSAVGVRDQLRRTSVVKLGMSLSQVFNQQHISRGASGRMNENATAKAEGSGLPPVVTLYAPADPVGVIRAYKPTWIAIDCADAPALVWLRPLLDEAKRSEIPVIAWAQNPLSECVKDFTVYGQTFVWPPSIQSTGHNPRKLDGDPEAILNSESNTSVLPIAMEGKSVAAFSALLGEAAQLLGRINVGGRFEIDAVAVHWRYLRSLESLAVPAEFYDAEAPGFWD